MAICSRFVSNFRDGSSQYSTRGVPETATRRHHLRTGVTPFDARTAVRGRPRVLRVDVRTCQNSSIFSILQCFTPVALVSHNSAHPDTSFVHFDP